MPHPYDTAEDQADDLDRDAARYERECDLADERASEEDWWVRACEIATDDPEVNFDIETAIAQLNMENQP